MSLVTVCHLWPRKIAWHKRKTYQSVCLPLLETREFISTISGSSPVVKNAEQNEKKEKLLKIIVDVSFVTLWHKKTNSLVLVKKSNSTAESWSANCAVVLFPSDPVCFDPIYVLYTTQIVVGNSKFLWQHKSQKNVTFQTYFLQRRIFFTSSRWVSIKSLIYRSFIQIRLYEFIGSFVWETTNRSTHQTKVENAATFFVIFCFIFFIFINLSIAKVY